jgi:nicotinamide-nucleotide amidase
VITSVELVSRLRDSALTIATAESITGGLLCATLVDAPGASDVVRGGVVAYAADVKVAELRVDPELIAQRGTIDEDVARSMADGVRERLGASIGVATTGNAGPEASEGKPVGSVWIAVADEAGTAARHLSASGDRSQIRAAAVRAAVSLVAARLGEESSGGLS